MRNAITETGGVRAVVFAAVLSGVSAGAARAADITLDWQGPAQGNADWNTGANWNDNIPPENDNYPNATGTNGEIADISDTLTGNRTISGTMVAESLTWGSTPAGFVDTIKLSANGQFRLGMAITNAGTAASKVLDVNGYSLSIPSSTQFASGNAPLTIRNSGGATGEIVARGFGGAAAIVESGVTLRVAGGSLHSMSALTMQDNTVYKVDSAENFRINSGPATGFWDMVVDQGHVLFELDVHVRNDVVINSGGIGWRYTTRSMSVAGDFIDSVVGAADYASQTAGVDGGTVVFSGGASTVRNVSVARTGITRTAFQVGNASTDGNIKLGNNLSTGANFKVTNGSTADLEAFTVSAATVNIDAGSILGYTFADADTGLIAASGLNGLTLNAFTLNLGLGGTWTNGNDLLLMTYSGTLNGTPSINFGNVPDGFSYESFDTSGGQVRLTNVAITVPEPSAALVAGGMLTLLGLARRRARRPVGIMD